MADENLLRAFVTDTREKAKSILDGVHHDAAVKELIKDFLQVIVSFEGALQGATGQSSDVRVLRKKLDQAQAGVRTAEKNIEKVKAMVLAVIEEIKIVSTEATQISKRHEGQADDPDALSALRIRTAAQKIVELIVESR